MLAIVLKDRQGLFFACIDKWKWGVEPVPEVFFGSNSQGLRTLILPMVAIHCQRLQFNQVWDTKTGTNTTTYIKYRRLYKPIQMLAHFINTNNTQYKYQNDCNLLSTVKFNQVPDATKLKVHFDKDNIWLVCFISMLTLLCHHNHS